MKLVQIVFSPTGGTGKVADIMAGEWNGTVARIDLSDASVKLFHTEECQRQAFFSSNVCAAAGGMSGSVDESEITINQEDIALVAVPSYGGRVPGLAAERLGKIQGSQARCIIVCVYGNRAYEDTLVELQDIVENCGFRTVAAVSAVAEHSIVHQYAAGRPDEKDAEELRGFAKTIFGELEASGLPASALEVPGNRPYKKAGGAGLVPKAAKDCVNCGLCAENCPAGAISRDSLKTADSRKCISCMRCVVKCPGSARKVNGAMVSAAALALKKACSERKGNELFM